MRRYVRKIGQAHFDKLKPEPYAGAVGRLREVSMSEVPLTSASEMMIAVAARMLKGRARFRRCRSAQYRLQPGALHRRA